MDEFIVASNPDPASRLPYLLRLPLPRGEQVLLATSARWPREKDLFCFQLAVWPEGAEIVERVPIQHCARRGKAIDLVLARRTARRSMFIWTRKRGQGQERTLIFWRSRRSVQAARPGVRVPHARGLENALEIAVDSRERYGWRFRRYAVAIRRRELPVGDYAVLEGDTCQAVVERKTAADLASSASSGALALLLAELEQVPHAHLVIEGRLSDLLKAGQAGGMRGGWLLNLVAALQVAHPQVGWTFAETRDLAQDFTYRWLAAASTHRPAPGAKPGPQLLDATARRALAVREARAGTVWTTRAYAERCGVSLGTAWQDLRALVAEGLLVAEGERRGRVYRAR